MLLSFKFSNFKSFKDEANISFVARKADKTLPGALIDEKRGYSGKDKLLPAMAIYGPNAAGKTNFLLALSYFRRAIVFSQANWKGGTGTRFDPCSLSQNPIGEFEAIFQVEGIVYKYGFSTQSMFFEKEWLFSYPRGRERVLFKRDLVSSLVSDVDGELNETTYELETGPTFSGDRREHESSFRRLRENSLFLSSAAQDNQAECKKIEVWFRRHVLTEIKLNIDALDQGMTSHLADTYPQFKSLLLPLLKAADPCIKDIAVKKLEDEDEVYEGAAKSSKRKRKVSFLHEVDGKIIAIPFEKQSRGIKRLYALAAGLVTALKFGRIIVVDELETSMHSQVASQLLALFQNRSSNPLGAQLLFTTHETRLLNLQHLRRDQVMFCEKDNSGFSSLFSLLEFAPRKDENFELGYLRGRYGAVPQAAIDPAWLSAINDDSIVLEGANAGE